MDHPMNPNLSGRAYGGLNKIGMRRPSSGRATSWSHSLRVSQGSSQLRPSA